MSVEIIEMKKGLVAGHPEQEAPYRYRCICDGCGKSEDRTVDSAQPPHHVAVGQVLVQSLGEPNLSINAIAPQQFHYCRENLECLAVGASRMIFEVCGEDFPEKSKKKKE